VTPVFRWQIRIRKEDLAYPVRVLHCYRLALSGLTGIVVELSEAQDVPGDFKEIGLSVLDRNRQGDGNFPSIVGCNAWLETRCEEKAVTFRSLPEHAAQHRMHASARNIGMIVIAEETGAVTILSHANRNQCDAWRASLEKPFVFGLIDPRTRVQEDLGQRPAVLFAVGLNRAT